MRAAVLAALLGGFLLASFLAVAPSARADAPSINLNPSQGPPMTPVQITGSGFAPGATVDMVWYTMEGNRVSGSGFVEVPSALGTATADAQGGVSFSFVAPYDLGGPPHRVDAVVGGSAVANASFTLMRDAWITPTSGPEGSVVTVRLVAGGWTQYDNNVAITYDNAFLGFACSFNSQGNISVWVQARGGVGPHVIGVYPAIYYGPSDGPTPWKHAVLNPADLPVRYEIEEFTFTITEGSGGVSGSRATDLKVVTAPDSLVVPNLPAVAPDDGTPQLALGNGATGIVGGDVPFALAGFPAGGAVQLRWNTVVGETMIEGDKNRGWVFTPLNFTVADVIASATGTASGTARVPADFGGDHLVEAVVGGEVLATATWKLVPSFTAFLSSDGSRVILRGTGLGWEKYTAVWDVLYDNTLTGFVSAMTSRGSVDVSLPVVGSPGVHTIDIHEGSNAWPYLNMHESPWPWEPVYRFAFTVPPPPGAEAEATVPLWLTAPIILAALVAGFLAGVVRRRKSPGATATVKDSE